MEYNKLGKYFSSVGTAAAYVVMAVCIIFIYKGITNLNILNIIIAAIILIFCFAIASANEFIEIDTKNKLVRSCIASFFFIKRKYDWVSVADFPYISVLSVNLVSTTYSRSNRSVEQREKKYYVYLLNENQTAKIHIHTFNNAKPAVDYCKSIAPKLNAEIVCYSPPISKHRKRHHIKN